MDKKNYANNEVRWPRYDNKMILKTIKNVLESNRWTITGYWTGQPSYEERFSRAFADYNNVNYCVLTTGGTTALQIALEALNVGYGDEVIVPALTWVATATAVLNVNAKPVLVDVEEDTMCISSEEIESAITKRTKAIIPVHLYGSVCDMDKIMNIARKNNLYVIEDCAQSHGAKYKDKRVGTIGHMGCFSMQHGKTLTAGGGGAVITNSEDLYKRLYQLRTDSRIIKDNKSLINYGDMEVEESGKVQGNNFCLSEFASAILLYQLASLDKEHDDRRINANYFERELNKLGYETQKRNEYITYSTYYGFAFKIKDNQNIGEIIDKIRSKINLGSFFVHQCYEPINKNSLFCPWTKRKYDNIDIDEKRWRNMDIVISQKLAGSVVVIHHSLLFHRHSLEQILEVLK